MNILSESEDLVTNYFLFLLGASESPDVREYFPQIDEEIERCHKYIERVGGTIEMVSKSLRTMDPNLRNALFENAKKIAEQEASQ